MRTFIFLASLFLFTNFFAQQTQSDNISVFKFETETIDYGTIKQNADGRRTFVFTNIGNTPINLFEIKTSCGCTVATKPDKPVMPGESGKISVEYATKKIGKFSKSIIVNSDAGERIILRIKGQVIVDDI